MRSVEISRPHTHTSRQLMMLIIMILKLAHCLLHPDTVTLCQLRPTQPIVALERVPIQPTSTVSRPVVPLLPPASLTARKLVMCLLYTAQSVQALAPHYRAKPSSRRFRASHTLEACRSDSTSRFRSWITSTMFSDSPVRMSWTELSTVSAIRS